ncbi:MAG: outer membrane PBP1 activator LpoA protein, partial [Paraglaciecola sp.]
LPANKPMLALNRIEKNLQATVLTGQDNSHREAYYFSLDPEDEARHLAKHIREKGFKRPIIFTAKGSTTQRMADAFVNEWQALNNSPLTIPPDLAVFTTNKDMRRQVSERLDVSQSKARIKQIENLATEEVHAVERNRRDIDAIVLFANPEQTELLNPIIESSLSPFARRTLSVFASSRSYSMDLSKNSVRDLRNLTFSDMPWMLPGHPWSDLATQAADLWPQRRDTLMRLFAMGYDAYQILPTLRHLRLLPHNSMGGLTGELSMDNDGQLHRRLPWAKITQDRVSLLAMD